jgi:hypothetical protein
MLLIRCLPVLPVLLIMLFPACVQQEQLPIDTQEYIFYLRGAPAFSRVLPADWEPKYEGGFIRIDPRHRVMAQDVLLIAPRFPLKVHEMRMVKLMRRMPPNARATYEIWVPRDTEIIIGDLPPNDLVKVAPHTWLRPNEFNVQFDRQP